jgi:hypothetical protein
MGKLFAWMMQTAAMAKKILPSLMDDHLKIEV